MTDEDQETVPLSETTTEPEGVAAAMAAVKTELESLGHTLDVIKFDRLAYETGLAESTIRKLFAGESVSPEEIDPPFKDRLRFLLETRLHEDGRPYTRPELAAAAHVHPTMITNLLNGKRQPGFETSRALAKHFKVPHFFTTGPEEALLVALKPVLEQARLLAELRGQRVTHVALRGSLTAGSDELSRDLQEAIRHVVASAQTSGRPAPPAPEPEDDPELRELTDTVRALPESSRSGVMGILRSVVGLARKTD
ncbi:helix-turn-helix domain-containing protein [Streptomyces sp. NBC_01601]|uniref:helix-turn-helix domain-containing protein n=1 Tax=Streptomyces sp. NBC_01601 TaxID=2975892 RepID=UPI002E2ABE4F|nr:helix-turn-helix transcriptional regulator [Streptomyces sp. NBC_01601]